MGSNLKVTYIGNGRVIEAVRKLVDKAGLPIEETEFVDCQVVLDGGGTQFGKMISYIGLDKSTISGDRALFSKFAKGIIDRVLFSSTHLYLNALAASETSNPKYAYMNITEKSFKTLDTDDLFSLPAVSDETLAKFLYQDLARVHHKFFPEYEANKKVERDKIAFAAKENIYAIAEKTGAEVIAQPCGIEPTLSTDDAL